MISAFREGAYFALIRCLKCLIVVVISVYFPRSPRIHQIRLENEIMYE